MVLGRCLIVGYLDPYITGSEALPRTGSLADMVALAESIGLCRQGSWTLWARKRAWFNWTPSEGHPCLDTKGLQQQNLALGI